MSKLGMAMSEPIHTVEYRVIYGDTDAAGVVYNANYLRYFEIARTEMMRHAGMTYRAIEDMGYVLPVTETYLRFKASAHYDDLVRLEVSLADLSKLTCRFHYAILRDEEDGVRTGHTLLAKGFTCHACVNREGKLAPFPVSVMELMTTLLRKNHADEEKKGLTSSATEL